MYIPLGFFFCQKNETGCVYNVHGKWKRKKNSIQSLLNKIKSTACVRLVYVLLLLWKSDRNFIFSVLGVAKWMTIKFPETIIELTQVKEKGKFDQNQIISWILLDFFLAYISDTNSTINKNSRKMTKIRSLWLWYTFFFASSYKMSCETYTHTQTNQKLYLGHTSLY